MFINMKESMYINISLLISLLSEEADFKFFYYSETFKKLTKI